MNSEEHIWKEYVVRNCEICIVCGITTAMSLSRNCCSQVAINKTHSFIKTKIRGEDFWVCSICDCKCFDITNVPYAFVSCDESIIREIII